MNKRLLVGLFSAFMAMAPWCGYAAPTGQTVDAPHVNVDSDGTTEDCTYCHFANYEPSDCGRCHMKPTAPFGDGTAPQVATHQGLSCQACHNPHVSLQAAGTQAAGTAGSYAGFGPNPPAGMTILTGVTPTPAASWAAKTGEQRGMILWVDDTWTDDQGHQVTDKASFEIKSISGDTVTVKGVMEGVVGHTFGTDFDLRRGQLIAKKVSKVAGTSYKQGDLDVQFPSPTGSPQIYVDTTNTTAPPTGVCQVCHTGTTYWTSTGGGTTHNPGRVCTECHKHDSGFIVTACNGCHQGVGLDGVPVAFTGHADAANPPNPQDDRAMPATGSDTAGQHQIHAVDYGIECATCHIGTGMVRAGSPPPTPVADGKTQIGFSMAKYPTGSKTKYDGQTDVTYEGTNSTEVTKYGSMTCSTVYCHSDGRSVRLGCATSTDVINEYTTVPQTTPPQVTVVSSRANVSLKWDGSSADPQNDTQDCNNCHGFMTGAANPILSGRHYTHLQRGIACYKCHVDTAKDDGSGNSIVDPTKRANHANGVYDVKGSGLNGANPIIMDVSNENPLVTQGTWNPTTKGCLITCHASYERYWTPNDTETCPDACSGLVNERPTIDVQCSNVDSQTILFSISLTDPDYNDTVKNQCGKNVGTTGGYNLKYGGGTAAWSVTKEVPEEWSSGNKLDGTPHLLIQAYPAGAVKAPNFALTGHNNPFVMAYVKGWDNSANSQAIAVADDVWNPGEGWGYAVQSTPDNFNYFPCEIRPDYDTMLNQPARVNFSKTQIDLNTILITDLSVDPDYNDTAKADYYDALAADGDGGHRGEGGYIHIYYNRGEGNAWHAMEFTDVATPRDIPHTRWNGSANVANAGPGSHSWALAAPGNVYFFYEVVDNHYLYQNPSLWSSTGWVSHAFQ